MLDVKKLRKRLVAPPGKKIALSSYDTGWTGGIHDKAHARRWLEDGVRRLSEHQEKLYAQDTYALLLIFQAMDAAGKDSTIKHVMSGVNPLGCQAYNFKAPSPEERDHDFLWRSVRALPERGRIGIHNRSYYEEVLVVRVHPEILAAEQLPPKALTAGVWKRRFNAINAFERHLVDSGTIVLKFFLNVSKEEQKRRFLERIEKPEKNWKFSLNDVRERKLWPAYMKTYEDAFTHTSTAWAPWFIVPADHKWFTRLAVAAIINDTLDGLGLELPSGSGLRQDELEEARKILVGEKE